MVHGKQAWYTFLLVIYLGSGGVVSLDEQGVFPVKAASAQPPTPHINNGSSTRTTGPTPPSGFFIWLSDLHFDPLYGQPLAYGGSACSSAMSPRCGRFKCDSPLELIHAALEAAATAAKAKPSSRPDFVIVSGDFVRHKTEGLPPNAWSIIRKALSATARALLRTFGPAAVFPVLGNNDLSPANYLPVTSETPYSTNTPLSSSQPYLSQLATLWLRHGLLLNRRERESFAHGGYFAREVVPARLWLIALNTVVYSLAHQPVTNSSDPFGQWAWVAAQLGTIRAQSSARAYLVGHVPPTLQSYHPGMPNWHARYIESYESLAVQYSDVIVGHCFGHTHSGELRVVTATGPTGAPVFSQGSVVPTGKDGVDDSNPTFSLVSYDVNSGVITDSALWAANLSTDSGGNCADWAPLLPSLKISLQLERINNAGVGRLGDALLRDDGLWETYRNSLYKAGVRQESCDAACRVQQACLVSSPLDTAQYSLCCVAAPTENGVQKSDIKFIAADDALVGGPHT